MPINQHGCDVDEIVHNAREQGVNFKEISVIYEGLTVDEKDSFLALDLLKVDNGDIVIASFTEDGKLLLPEKVKSVYYLGA